MCIRDRVSVNASDDGVQVIISGEGMRPPEGSLQDALRGKIFELPVTLEIVPQTRVRFKTVDTGNR